MSLTDVYHVEAPYLINYYLSANNYNGAEPVPDSALINEGQNTKFDITPGQTYMFHVVNMGAIAGQFLQFDQHNMTIIEADGVYTQPYEVSQLFVAVAQRYTVLVTALPSNCENFAIVSQFLTDMFDSSVTPAGQQPTVSSHSIFSCCITNCRSARPIWSITLRLHCQRPSHSHPSHGTTLCLFPMINSPCGIPAT